MKFSIHKVIELLEKEVSDYQVPVVDLIAAQTKDHFKILVATILSARTRDEVTAAACKKLFKQVDTPEDLTKLSVTELEKIIYPVGFFKNKAKYLSMLPGVLHEKFHSQVPNEMDLLLQLPGVGRKTANLVLSVAFGIPAICVDTHVHRIMNIWGFVATETPLQTEIALRQNLPKQYWIKINSLLVAFGQATCKPVRPHCDRCVLCEYCPRIGIVPRQLKEKAFSEIMSAEVKNIVSWNVNGLRAVLKKGFLDVVTKFNADIFAIQEIKAFPEQLPDAVKNLEGYQVYWNPAEKKGYSGTAVFSKIKPLNVFLGLDREKFDNEGRVLTLEYTDFFLMNIYFPNAQHGLKRLDYKIEFDHAVLEFMGKLEKKKSVIVCGDLNVAHKPIDLANPRSNENNPGYTPEERAWMDKVIIAGYIDTFRMFDSGPGKYTWWSYRGNVRERNIGWRIDYFIVDQGSRNRVRNASIHEDILGSDHCPVSLNFI
jgi:exodeoxyribonuclease-3